MWWLVVAGWWWLQDKSEVWFRHGRSKVDTRDRLTFGPHKIHMRACMLACRMAIWRRLGTKHSPEQAAVWGQRGPENQSKQTQNARLGPKWYKFTFGGNHFCPFFLSSFFSIFTWVLGPNRGPKWDQMEGRLSANGQTCKPKLGF